MNSDLSIPAFTETCDCIREGCDRAYQFETRKGEVWMVIEDHDSEEALAVHINRETVGKLIHWLLSTLE